MTDFSNFYEFDNLVYNKQQDVEAAKEEKLKRLRARTEWKEVVQEGPYDADTLKFVGDEENTRTIGYDATERNVEKGFISPRKLELDRARLAEENGMRLSQVTPGDVSQAGDEALWKFRDFLGYQGQPGERVFAYSEEFPIESKLGPDDKRNYARVYNREGVEAADVFNNPIDNMQYNAPWNVQQKMKDQKKVHEVLSKMKRAEEAVEGPYNRGFDAQTGEPKIQLQENGKFSYAGHTDLTRPELETFGALIEAKDNAAKNSWTDGSWYKEWAPRLLSGVANIGMDAYEATAVNGLISGNETLADKVSLYNENLMRWGNGREQDKITPEEVAQYNIINQKAADELTPEDQEFMKSYKAQVIGDQVRDIEEEKTDLRKLDRMRRKVYKITNREKDESFNVTQKEYFEKKEYGKMAAHAILNFNYIPAAAESLAFSAVLANPYTTVPAMMGMISNKTFGNERAFQKEHGRRMTAEEERSNYFWSTMSTLFEKFGADYVFGNIPGAKELLKKASFSTPKSIKSLIKIPEAVFLEGSQGAATEISDQLAMGQSLDTFSVLEGAIAEAGGALGQIGAVSAMQAPGQAAVRKRFGGTSPGTFEEWDKQGTRWGEMAAREGLTEKQSARVGKKLDGLQGKILKARAKAAKKGAMQGLVETQKLMDKHFPDYNLKEFDDGVLQEIRAQEKAAKEKEAAKAAGKDNYDEQMAKRAADIKGEQGTGAAAEEENGPVEGEGEQTQQTQQEYEYKPSETMHSAINSFAEDGGTSMGESMNAAADVVLNQPDAPMEKKVEAVSDLLLALEKLDTIEGVPEEITQGVEGSIRSAKDLVRGIQGLKDQADKLQETGRRLYSLGDQVDDKKIEEIADTYGGTDIGKAAKAISKDAKSRGGSIQDTHEGVLTGTAGFTGFKTYLKQAGKGQLKEKQMKAFQQHLANKFTAYQDIFGKLDSGQRVYIQQGMDSVKGKVETITPEEFAELAPKAQKNYTWIEGGTSLPMIEAIEQDAAIAQEYGRLASGINQEVKAKGDQASQDSFAKLLNDLEVRAKKLQGEEVGEAGGTAEKKAEPKQEVKSRKTKPKQKRKSEPKKVKENKPKKKEQAPEKQVMEEAPMPEEAPGWVEAEEAVDEEYRPGEVQETTVPGDDQLAAAEKGAEAYLSVEEKEGVRLVKQKHWTEAVAEKFLEFLPRARGASEDALKKMAKAGEKFVPGKVTDIIQAVKGMKEKDSLLNRYGHLMEEGAEGLTKEGIAAVAWLMATEAEIPERRKGGNHQYANELGKMFELFKKLGVKRMPEGNNNMGWQANVNLFNTEEGLPDSFYYAMASVALSWAANDAQGTLYNDAHNIALMLHGSYDSNDVAPSELADFREAGLLVSREAARMGREARKILGIQVKSLERSEQYKFGDLADPEKLDASLGLWTIMLMEDAGLVETNQEKIQAWEDGQGGVFWVPLSRNQKREKGQIKTLNTIKASGENGKLTGKIGALAKQVKGSDKFFEAVNGRRPPRRNWLDAPKEDTAQKLRSAMFKLGRKQKKALKVVQNQPWKRAEKNLELFMKLDQEMKDIILKKEDPEGAYILDRDAIETRNRRAEKSQAEIEEYAKDAPERTYFGYYYMNQLRLLMDSTGVNPLADKMHRFMVIPEGSETEFVPKESPDMEILFRLSVIQALGSDFDKNNLEAVLPEFQQIYKEYDEAGYLDATDADAFNKLMQQQVALEAKGKKGVFPKSAHALAGVAALQAYKAYKTGKAETVKTELGLEVDGITNGYAIGLMQFVGNLVDAPQTVKQRFLMIGVGEKGEYEKNINPNFRDAYRTTAGNFAVAMKALIHSKEQKHWMVTKRRVTALEQISSEDVVNSQEMVTKFGRNLMKYPFMIINYSGGLPKIAEGLVKSLRPNIYAHLARAHSLAQGGEKAAARKVVNDFMNSVHALLTHQNDHKFYQEVRQELLRRVEAGSEGKNSILDYEIDFRRLESAMAWVYTPILKEAFRELTEETKPIKDALAGAMDVIAFHFMEKFDYEVWKYQGELAANGQEHRAEKLSRQEKLNIANRLIRTHFPRLTGAWQDTTEDDQVAFLDMIGHESETKDSDEYVVRNDILQKNGRTTTKKTTVSKINWAAPGAKFLVRSVQNIDASVAVTNLVENPASLSLHDAIQTGLHGIGKAVQGLNDKFWELNKNYSIVENVDRLYWDTMAKERLEKRALDGHLQDVTDLSDLDRAKELHILEGWLKRIDDLPAKYPARDKLIQKVEKKAKELGLYQQGEYAHPKNALDLVKLMKSSGPNTAMGWRATELEDMYQRMAHDPESVPSDQVEFQLEEQVRIAKANREALFSEKYGLTKEGTNQYYMPDIPEGNEARALLEKVDGKLFEGQQVETGKEETAADFEEQEVEQNEELVVPVEEVAPDDTMGSMGTTSKEFQQDLVLRKRWWTATEKNIQDVHKELGRIDRDTGRDSVEDEEHRGRLDRIMGEIIDPLFRGIGRMTLTLNQTEKLANGWYDGGENSVTVNYSDNAPETYSEQSRQEVYVHELVHAVISKAVANSPRFRQSLRGLQKAVEKELTREYGEGHEWKAFLATERIPGRNAGMEAEIAKKQYEAAFADGSMQEFVDYALTNKHLSKKLTGMKAPKGKFFEGDTWYEKVFHALVEAQRRLSDLIDKKTVSGNAYEMVVDLTKEATGLTMSRTSKIGAWMDEKNKNSDALDDWIKKKGVSVRDQYGDKVADKVFKANLWATKYTEMAARGMYKATGKIRVDRTKQNKKESVKSIVKDTVGAVADTIALSPMLMIIAAGAFQKGKTWEQKVSRFSDTIDSIEGARKFVENKAISELYKMYRGFFYRTPFDIQKLLNESKHRVEQARVRAKEENKAYLRSMFVDNGKYLEQKHKDALTLVFGYTEIYRLLENQVYSVDEVMKLISDSKHLNQTIKLELAALGIKPGSYWDNQIHGLAERMIHQKQSRVMIFDNVKTMLLNAPEGYELTEKEAQRVDFLISMVALKEVGPDARALVGEVAEVELDDKANEFRETNGIVETMVNFSAIRKRALETAFKDEAALMTKGYLSKIHDPHKSLEAHPVDAATQRLMADKGFTLEKTFPLMDGETVQYGLYHAKNLPLQTQTKGLFSTTSKQRAHTSKKEIFAREFDTRLEKIWDEARRLERKLESPITTEAEKASLKQRVGTLKNKAQKLSSRKRDIVEQKFQRLLQQQKAWVGAAVDERGALRPIVNPKGEVVDFTVDMSRAEEERYLNMNKDLFDVSAETIGTVVDKAESEVINEEGIDLIQKRFDEHYEGNEHEFINLMDVRWADETFVRLPYKARTRIQKIARENGGKFMVEEAYLDVLFGYRNWSVGEVFEKIGKHKAALWTRRIEEGINGIVGIINNNIVVKTPAVGIGNMVSNYISSIMLGVPPWKVVPYWNEALKELGQIQKDGQELAILDHRAKGNPAYGKKMASRRRILVARINANGAKELIDAGLYASITTEEMYSDEFSYKNQAIKYVTDKTNELPHSEVLTGIVKGLYMADDTALYKSLLSAIQVSDFVGRYGVYKHMVEVQGKSKVEAYKYIQDVFVDYNIPVGKFHNWANSMGLILFYKYWLMIQRPIFGIIKNHPSKALFGLGMRALFGVKASNIFNSGVLTGGNLAPMSAAAHPVDSLVQLVSPSGVEFGVDLGKKYGMNAVAPLLGAGVAGAAAYHEVKKEMEKVKTAP